MKATKIRLPRRAPRIKGYGKLQEYRTTGFDHATGRDLDDSTRIMKTVNSLGGLCGFMPGTNARKRDKVPDPLRNILSSHPVCHNEGVVMGGPQRPNILIGPGPGLPTNWRG